MIMANETKIADAYPHGQCPDCGETIPPNACAGALKSIKKSLTCYFIYCIMCFSMTVSAKQETFIQFGFNGIPTARAIFAKSKIFFVWVAVMKV